jgi:hypothetical protein
MHEMKVTRWDNEVNAAKADRCNGREQIEAGTMRMLLCGDANARVQGEVGARGR